MRQLLILLVFTYFGYAAGVSGIVKDPAGAAVAGAPVEVRAVPPTGPAKNTKTDTAGKFQFSNLASTHFRVRVAQPGFEPFETDVVVEDGKDATVEVNLKIAVARESLEVAAGKRQNVDPVYRALRTGEAGDTFTVENLVIKRDAGVLTLKKGNIALSAPAMGRDTMAIFSGEGEFAFDPPLGIEKAHLKTATDQETVREIFDRAIFCFTDETGREIRSGAKSRPADSKLADQMKDFRKRVRSSDYDTDNLDAMILADLYNPKQDGFFSAYLHGRKHSDLQFHVKPRAAIPGMPSPEEVAVVNVDPGGEQSGIWYLAHRMGELTS